MPGAYPDPRSYFPVGNCHHADFLKQSPPQTIDQYRRFMRGELTRMKDAGSNVYNMELGWLDLEIKPDDTTPLDIEARDDSDQDTISITFSELAAFIDCGLAFRFRNLMGFQPRLAPELGYGKAVHHVMRAVAEATKASGHVPTEAEIDELLDTLLVRGQELAHLLLSRRLRTVAIDATELQKGNGHEPPPAASETGRRARLSK